MILNLKDIERRKALYPAWESDGIPVKFPCANCGELITRARPKEKTLTCTRCGVKTGYPKEV